MEICAPKVLAFLVKFVAEGPPVTWMKSRFNYAPSRLTRCSEPTDDGKVNNGMPTLQLESA